MEPFDIKDLQIESADYIVGEDSISLGQETDPTYQTDLAKVFFGIADPEITVTKGGQELPNYIFEKIDRSKSEVIFTDNFSEDTTIGMGDRYRLDVENLSENTVEDIFQEFKYFIIDNDKNRHDVTDKVIYHACDNEESEIKESVDELNPVTFNHNGWLGAKYALKNINTPDVDIAIVKNAWNSDYISEEILRRKLDESEHPINSTPIKNVYDTAQDPSTVEYILNTTEHPDDPKYEIETSSDGSDDLWYEYNIKLNLDEADTLLDYVTSSQHNCYLMSPVGENILSDVELNYKFLDDSNTTIVHTQASGIEILTTDCMPSNKDTNAHTSFKSVVVNMSSVKKISADAVSLSTNWSVLKNTTLYLSSPKYHAVDLDKEPYEELRWDSKILDIYLLDAESAEDVSLFISNNLNFVKDLKIDYNSIKGIPYDITLHISSFINLEEIEIPSNDFNIYIKVVSENIITYDDNSIRYNLLEDSQSYQKIWWTRTLVGSGAVNLYKISAHCLNPLDSPEPFERSLEHDSYLDEYIKTLPNDNSINWDMYHMFCTGEDGNIINTFIRRTPVFDAGGATYDPRDYKMPKVVISSDLEEIAKNKKIDFSSYEYGNFIPWSSAQYTFCDLKFTGDEDPGYDKWYWHADSKHITLQIRSTKSDLKDFGLLYNNIVIKETSSGIKTRHVSANIKEVNASIGQIKTIKNTISFNSDLKNSEILSLRITFANVDDLAQRYVYMDKYNNNVQLQIEQSPHYIVDGTYGKLVKDPEDHTKAKVLLLEPKRLFGKNYSEKDKSNMGVLSADVTTAEIIQYRYWKTGDNININVEWDDYINHSEATCCIKDSQGNVVKLLNPGIGSTDVFRTSFSLTDLVTEGAYIFEYVSGKTKWRRPIFLNTKLTSKDELSYSDYKDACYDELVDIRRTLDLAIEDIPDFGQFQIVQAKDRGTFTHDSRSISERKNGFWWSMVDEVKENFADSDLYFGTRLYKKIRIPLKDYGFVKGKTTFAVSVNADGYDKEKFIRANSIYEKEDSEVFEAIIPVAENKRLVTFDPNTRVYPYTKQYLIQDSFPSLENTQLFSSEDDPTREKTAVLGKMCGWDTPKILHIDKLDGENNDCRVSWADPNKYDDSSQCFENGDIISGEGDVKNKIGSNLKSMFVPILARIKSNDNGFVFPIPENPKWKYKEKYIEARGKKNSDNKRDLKYSLGSAESPGGIRSIVCTKNNMAAALTTLILGAGEVLAMISTWIALAAGAIAASIFTAGTSLVVFAAATGPMIALSSAVIAQGLSLFTAGLTELLKKEKTFKIIAVRGFNRLLLPLLGQQDDLEKFAGQIRYETDITPKKRNDEIYASFGEIERMMYAIGSRIYARKYYTKSYDSDQCKKPIFDNTETKLTNFRLILTVQNCELQCGNYSIEALNKIFVDIWGIESNNFTSKGAPSLTLVYDFDNYSVKNQWMPSDDNDPRNTLEEQCGNNFCTTSPENVNKCYIHDREAFENDPLMLNLEDCIRYDDSKNVFFYHESLEGEDINVNNDDNIDKWTVTDARWAFGPNRGGCAMRLCRQFYRGVDHDNVSKDYDYIVNGEYPVFSTLSATPIAYPIIPTNLREEGWKKDNYFNSYSDGAASNQPIVKAKNWSAVTPLIEEDCIDYLKFVYYAQLQNTDETN